MKKTVLIGVTACVAIYKTCEIIRGLQKAGVRAKVVMTEHSTNFINPTLFRSLTREPVAVGLFDDRPGDPIHHISLSKEADLFLIAPCTANVIAKLAHGIADDLLTTTALATKAPIVIAPAMNVNMYENVATQENMETLRSRGIAFIDAESGYLACGDVGKGRLADPSVIVSAVLEMLEVKRDLEGKRVLVTAGPTVEPIDAVRFISNPSSGKTGFAIAEAAVRRGADVTLVTGPVDLDDVEGAKTVRVRTACEMFLEVDTVFDDADIAVFTAAVSDFRPSIVADGKLKKGIDDEALTRIELVENPDILATMGKRKRAGQVVVGFAAETGDVEANAREKLVRKNADFIVGNDVSEGKAFGADENQVLLVTKDDAKPLPLMSKADLANVILDAALEQ
ncbi:MAG: bifunctional phosphopantothenoylcysteine decarboxylase/phosphopantothenate--cysteine ligase CoaBC [Eggerthellaceae bacterium]|nr:bifunctional phosphopantothenoylcysteine decarboxylase/phosphopantothenate--cysteine ligase CoaBC [Eggerthellaceae bacterium]